MHTNRNGCNSYWHHTYYTYNTIHTIGLRTIGCEPVNMSSSTTWLGNAMVTDGCRARRDDARTIEGLAAGTVSSSSVRSIEWDDDADRRDWVRIADLVLMWAGFALLAGDALDFLRPMGGDVWFIMEINVRYYLSLWWYLYLTYKHTCFLWFTAE